MGPAGQLTPPVIEMETELAALLYERGQSSPTANLPAVTSSQRDLLDLAHLLNHLAGPIVDASDYNGGHGRAVELDDGVRRWRLWWLDRTLHRATPSCDGAN